MSPRLALGAFFLFAFTHIASARDPWIYVRSPNFDLITMSDEETGKQSLIFFEQVRKAFTESLGLKLPGNRALTIIAFRDEADYAPYRPQSNVMAYTMSLSGRNFIIMQDLVPEHYPIALHEYTHVLIDQAGMKLPLWLNEGFAEFFSTLKPVGRKILVGRIIPDRLQAVQGKLYPLHDLLIADNHSALYQDPKNSGLFHAQSWALVHMLKFSENYSARFDRVLDAIGRGEPGEQVLQTVYNKTTAQIQGDLAAYVQRPRFREGVIHARLEQAVPEPTLAPVDPVEVRVALAGIESLGPHRDEALRKLQALGRDNPANPLPFEAIAGIEARNGNLQAAADSLRHALASGTRNAALCFQLAMSLRSTLPDADYVAALQRAVDVDPDAAAAQLQLAEHAFNAHDFAGTVKRLHQVKKLDRANAFPYYRMLALASLGTGNLAEAKSACARTQQYVVTPEEKRIADELVKSVNGAKPTANP